MIRPIWFWTDIASPHMISLYDHLIDCGVPVQVVTEIAGPGPQRTQLGWPADFERLPLRAAHPREVPSLVAQAPASAVHICSGLDHRSVAGRARTSLAAARRDQFAILETVNDQGVRRAGVRLKYRFLLKKYQKGLRGILAIGDKTREWLIDRGAEPAKVFPFAYFLEPPSGERAQEPSAMLRFCYVGRLIRLKRVDLLIRAFARAKLRAELEIVGFGPEEARLRDLAARLAPKQIHFRPPVALSEVPRVMALADYLVLPSRRDGWGAVIVEGLMMGTPVICSDSCGAAVAVRASGAGWVFGNGNMDELTQVLQRAASAGRPTTAARAALRTWAKCFSGEAGAEYLQEILSDTVTGSTAQPPWSRELTPSMPAQ